MKLFSTLQKNKDYLRKKLPSDDIVFSDIKVGDTESLLIFAKEIVNKDGIGELILRPATNFEGQVSEESVWKAFFSPEKTKLSDLDEVVTQILNGNAVLICDKLCTAISFGLQKFEKRPIAEPPTSTVIKGPREGFVENLSVNVSLIRRRIKSPHLVFEESQIGKYSKTTVAICYIDNVTDKELVEKIRDRLKTINIDAILDSSYITKYLSNHNPSLFKQVGNTEKPDILVAKILEGRVAIMVDGSPIVLTVPYLLVEDFQSPSDYYNSSYAATTARIVRLFSVIISLFLPAFFVAAELFHLQLIPLSLLLTIVNSIKGIPLSPSYEMFFTFLIFEILNEASVRMPKYVGMVVSIVGGLVLGETAVNAGIISPPTLMVIALSGICLYTVPELEQPFSFIRLFFLLIAGSLGIYAMIVATALLVLYLVSFESFSTPLCAPFSPLVKSDLKDSFYKGYLLNQKNRPLSLKNVNGKRLGKAKEEDDDATT